jgi:DNA-binding response OmpR family regulator
MANRKCKKEIKNHKDQKKILIIDDEPDVCIVLESVLDENGFQADSYTEVLLALENFKAGTYDLLLLDIKMPDMDGFQLYQEMKKIDNKVKVCFLTAGEIYGQFAELDKDLFFRKPINNEELINKINRIIGSNREE